MQELVKIDAAEQIKRFQDFLEYYYLKKITENLRKDNKFIVIDFAELSKFDLDLANELLESPEEVIKAAELAVEQFDLEDIKGFKVRFENLPQNQKIMIRNVRSKHIGRFMNLEGVVRQKSDVRPQVTAAKFECPVCGNIINVLQLNGSFKEPSKCGCGRKGKFTLISKELVDAQGIVLEEVPESLEGGEQPKRINILLKNDLVSPLSERKTNPGSKIGIIGIIKEVPIILKTGTKSTRFDLMLEANYIEAVEETFYEVEITEDDEQKIIELSQDQELYPRLIDSVAPSIYGYSKEKEALLLQLVGGVRKVRSDKVVSRGDMHILLVGDPGAGKSAILKRISDIAPKGRYVAGRGVSGAGLCISPKSVILTNPGGMECIESIVESRLKSKEEFRPGIWKEDNINDIKIQSLDNNLKLHAKHPKSIWKLKSPKIVYEVVLSSGKKIELTGNTQLLAIENGKSTWKKSMELQEGMFIATPRKLIPGRVNKRHCVDLLKSNPVVHNIKPFAKGVVRKLAQKYGSIRDAAKKLDVSEDSLYHNWVNENARGNIKLQSFRKICENAGIDWKEKVKTVSLYNGKNHLLPTYLTKDFLYVAGLIAGDGDIGKGKHSYSIRFSNSNDALQKIFRKTLKAEFGFNCNVQKGNEKRPESSRVSSVLLAEILMCLGIPFSPKSDKIRMSNVLLHLSNELISKYISGLFDSDGSVQLRKTKGSDCIDLTTCSEELARQLQLVLLRFGIHATLRKRSPSPNKRIKGKLRRYVVELRGKSNIGLFAKNVGFRHPSKNKKLKSLVEKKIRPNTNVDIIPNTTESLRKEMQRLGLTSRKIRLYRNLSRGYAQRILEEVDCKADFLKEVKKLAFSDIFWEKIKSISPKKADYEYVYDLTVEDSHNFVVDGVLVHNTAAVVRDEFLKGWSLEAGALVLASNGICCLHPETKVIVNNKIKNISDLYVDNKKIIGKCKNEFIELNNIRADVISFDLNDLNIEKDFSTLVRRKWFDGYQANITFKSGFSIKLTPDHMLIDGKDLRWKKAGDFMVGGKILAPLKLPNNSKEYYITDILPKDWKVFLSKQEKNRIKKYIKKRFKFLNGFNRLFDLDKNYLSGNKQLTVDKFIQIVKYFGQEDYWKALPLKFGRSKNGERLKISKINAELGYIIGFIYGDGHVKINQRRTNIFLTQSTKHKDYMRKFKNCWNKIFLKNLGEYESERSNNIRGRLVQSKCKVFNCSSNLLGGIYKYCVGNSLENILSLSDEALRGFVAGVMDSDGCISKKKCIKDGRTYFTQIVEILFSNKLEDNLNFLLALRRFDCYGNFYNKAKNIKSIVISGREDIKNIIDNLKHYSVKISKVNLLTKKKLISSDSDKIPSYIAKSICERISELNKSFLVKNGIWSAIYDFKYLRREPSRDQLLKIIRKTESEIKDPALIDNSLKLIKRDYFLDEIVSIKKERYNGYVYDLYAPKNHNFLANGVIVHNCIDEMDKMVPEDRSAMHEALEQQTVSISKANIQATLISRTTVLAAANPKFGRFDPYGIIAEQIDLPPALINRFDLIFPIKDLPDETKDEKMASHILKLHQEPDFHEPDIPTEFLRKYIAYARQKVEPSITNDALQEIKEFYLKMRASGGAEEGIKAIPISARQLEALVRFSEASARLRLSNKATKKDAKRAIELVEYCLMQVGLDRETGKIDIDRIATGISASQRSHIVVIKEIINDLENRVGKTIPIPIDDVIEEAKDKGISEEKVEEVLEKLKRVGEVFEPRRSFIQKL